ncbi:hypothetical protein [Phenylobacterium sp.]|uniref:hypothetical protein n=1 Tax=Phenylobacterium sp. TaxID=1871053 RepID=UPI0025DB5F38|nr:hypothetical protein [Phenylobacterium sp.]MCA3721378.1 hypothetical protein [Phenylobacterium sp.]
MAFDLGGWRFLMSEDHRFASRERVAAAAEGGSAIGVYLEEHVMVSGAFGAEEGRLVWSVQHDPEQGLEHLDVWGEPPAALEDIRDRLLAELRTLEDTDTVFNAPVDLAATICGFDPNAFSGEVEMTGLKVVRKDLMKLRDPVLAADLRDPGTTPPAGDPPRPGFLARLFGRR